MCRILCFLSIMVLLFSGTRAEINYEDPLNGNFVIGNSAEIVVVWPSADFDTIYQKIYDYTPYTLTLIGESARPNGGNGCKYKNELDAVSLDADQDGFDDIITFFRNGTQEYVMVTPGDTGIIDFSTSHIETALGEAGIRVIGLRSIDSSEIGNWLSEIITVYPDPDACFLDNIRFNHFLFPEGSIDPNFFGYGPGGRCWNDEHEKGWVYDIAALDIEGDGIDEIALFKAEPHGFPFSQWYLSVEIVEVYNYFEESEPFPLFDLNDFHPIDNDDPFTSPFAIPGPTVIASGDFNNDSYINEFVVGYQISDQSFTFDGSIYHYEVTNRQYLQPMKINSTHNGVVYDTLNRVLHSEYYETYDLPFVTEFPNFSVYPISLCTGDLNKDGRDEILFYAYDSVKIYECDSLLSLTQVASIPLNNPINSFSNRNIAVEDLNAGPEISEWLPEIIVANHNLSGDPCIQVYIPQLDTANNITGVQNVFTLLDDDFNFNPVAVTLGDIDGDAIKLGPPRHFVLDSIIQPLIILNAPPTHFDVIGTDTCDINACYPGDCNFTAVYSEVASITYGIETNLHSDFAISTGVTGGGTYFGYGVEGHFSAEYGMDFSKVQGTSDKIKISQTITASKDDWIYATTAVYDVWEYPVYKMREFTGYVSLIIPKYHQESWFPSKSWKGFTYIPDHEAGNILSYPDYTDLLNNPDAVEVFTHGQWHNSYAVFENSHNTWSLNWNQVSNSGASTAWDVNLEAGVSFTAPNYSFSFEGEYGMGQRSTHTSSISEDITVTVDLYGIDATIGESGYHVTPYAFHAKNGALIVDYTVAPESSPTPGLETWWDLNYGQLYDPAFILPWRLNPEKGMTLEFEAKRHLTKEISFDPPVPEPGDVVTITARIHNFSLLPIPGGTPIKVSFYMGDPDDGGTLLTDTSGAEYVIITDSLPPRGFVNVQFDWLFPEEYPQHPWIYAVIDPEDNFLETHEENNKGFNILFLEGGYVDVDEHVSEILPEKYMLSQNYPNPFNLSTNIMYRIPEKSHVTITVFNLLGQKVKTLVDETKSAGEYRVRWDGNDEYGQEVSTGIYFYRIKAGDYAESRKMLLLK